MSGTASSSAAIAELVAHERNARPGTFIEHPQITQLGATLRAINAGDRIIKGRVELFACSRRRLNFDQQQDLQRRAPDSITDSPLGPMSLDSAQIILMNLRSFMSLLFVDYDCTSLSPNDFERCTDKLSVVNKINHSLVAVVDRMHSGYLSEFWQVVQNAIDLTTCDVYEFKPRSGTFEPADNSLMSFHFFFIDTLRERILFVGSMTKGRGTGMHGVDSDSDVVPSASGSEAMSKDAHSSDMGSSLQEGEYAFSENSADEGMLD